MFQGPCRSAIFCWQTVPTFQGQTVRSRPHTSPVKIGFEWTVPSPFPVKHFKFVVSLWHLLDTILSYRHVALFEFSWEKLCQQIQSNPKLQRVQFFHHSENELTCWQDNFCFKSRICFHHEEMLTNDKRHNYPSTNWKFACLVVASQATCDVVLAKQCTW